MKIPDGELDRELVLRHDRHHLSNGTTSDHKITAKVGKKKFVLSDRFSTGKSLSFEKRADGDIDITVHYRQEVKQKCSLGHEHIIESKSDVYNFFEIPEAHVENLVEWINHGNWAEVNAREPRWKKVLRECKEIMSRIEDPVLKAAAKALRYKINEQLEDHMENLLLK